MIVEVDGYIERVKARDRERERSDREFFAEVVRENRKLRNRVRFLDTGIRRAKRETRDLYEYVRHQDIERDELEDACWRLAHEIQSQSAGSDEVGSTVRSAIVERIMRTAKREEYLNV